MTTSMEIRLQTVKGIGPKRLERILTKLNELGQGLDDLFKMPSSEIAEKFQLPKSVAEAITNAPAITRSESQSEILERKSIKILTSVSEDYPRKLQDVLGKDTPTSLYVWGNLDLLNKPSVGFCGSRNVTERGVEVTIDTAERIVELGWVVVSGHARGVDTAAHKVALEKGGNTIIVLAEGVLDFRLRRELKKIAKPEQLLIVSQFAPTAKWTVGNAMIRNKTIIGLSDAMVLVEARREGGTFEAGKAALKLNIPLFVAEYESSHENTEGNEYFLRKGARNLRKSKKTSRANIDPLREAVLQKQAKNSGIAADKIEEDTPQIPEQLSLIESILV